jgi:hypothetical protein
MATQRFVRFWEPGRLAGVLLPESKARARVANWLRDLRAKGHRPQAWARSWLHRSWLCLDCDRGAGMGRRRP